MTVPRHYEISELFSRKEKLDEMFDWLRLNVNCDEGHGYTAQYKNKWYKNQKHSVIQVVFYTYVPEEVIMYFVLMWHDLFVDKETGI
jgi:hypothetical protein